MSERIATNTDVAAALRRVLHEIGQEFDEKTEERVHSMLAYELERVDPNTDWANIMTDNWPLRSEHDLDAGEGPLEP